MRLFTLHHLRAGLSTYDCVIRQVTYLHARSQRRLWHPACWAAGPRWRAVCVSSGYQAKQKVLAALVWWKAARQLLTSYGLKLSLCLPPKKSSGLVSCLLSRSAGSPLGPARTSGWFVPRFIGQLCRLWFTSSFAFEYMMSVKDWRSQQCVSIKINRTINCIHWFLSLKRIDCW